MPIKALCQHKVNKTEAVSELKDAIKEKKQKAFTYVDADQLKLWKVKISPQRREL